MMRYGYYDYGSSLIGLGFACLMMLAVLTLFVLGIIFLVRAMRRAPEHGIDHGREHIQRQSNALTLLNERLAKGEITEEEYEKIKSKINS